MTFHYITDQFSSFQLSCDGSKLLYVAEEYRPEGVSFFAKGSAGDHTHVLYMYMYVPLSVLLQCYCMYNPLVIGILYSHVHVSMY